jgi:hypothetical protein
MQKMTFNDILQNISFLPPEEQYIIAEVLSKRVRDLRRRNLMLRAQEAEENAKSGNLPAGNARDLMKAVGDD